MPASNFMILWARLVKCRKQPCGLLSQSTNPFPFSLMFSRYLYISGREVRGAGGGGAGSNYFTFWFCFDRYRICPVDLFQHVAIVYKGSNDGMNPLSPPPQHFFLPNLIALTVKSPGGGKSVDMMMAPSKRQFAERALVAAVSAAAGGGD